ncbi:MAG: hypothetical protein U0930_04755 [Pirellulales bacterium]
MPRKTIGESKTSEVAGADCTISHTVSPPTCASLQTVVIVGVGVAIVSGSAADVASAASVNSALASMQNQINALVGWLKGN